MKQIYKNRVLFFGINIYLNVITCEGKIVIRLILQSCVLHWYLMYIFNSVIDRTEAMIFYYVYWPVIRDPSGRMEIIGTLTNIKIVKY